MGKLVLQVRRGGLVLGSWTLGPVPLELTLRDSDSDEELAVFTARGSLSSEPTLIRGDLPRTMEDDFTMPLPELTADRMTTESGLPDRDLGDDLTMPLPELSENNPTTGAEVWKRVNDSWRVVGRLPPGHQLTAFDGSVALRRSGAVVVRAGPKLSGTATLPDGSSIAIRASDKTQALPPGASVMLRCGEEGIYIRSEVPLDGDT